MSDEARVLRHLQRGPLTKLQALRLYGVMHLGDRILRLRAKGHKIQTEMVKKGEKRYAKYRLIA